MPFDPSQLVAAPAPAGRTLWPGTPIAGIALPQLPATQLRVVRRDAPSQSGVSGGPGGRSTHMDRAARALTVTCRRPHVTCQFPLPHVARGLDNRAPCEQSKLAANTAPTQTSTSAF